MNNKRACTGRFGLLTAADTGSEFESNIPTRDSGILSVVLKRPFACALSEYSMF